MRNLRIEGGKLLEDILFVGVLLVPGGVAALWAHRQQIFMDCLQHGMVNLGSDMAVEKCVAHGYTLEGVGDLLILVLFLSALFWAGVILLYLIGQGFTYRYITTGDGGDTGG